MYAGTAEAKGAERNEVQLEMQTETRRATETVIGIVLGIDTAIKKRKENATETKIVEKGTAIETVTVTATGIGIDIVEMIKTVTGKAGKSETLLAGTPPQVFPHQHLKTAAYLPVLILQDIEMYQMATKTWEREEGLLRMR